MCHLDQRRQGKTGDEAPVLVHAQDGIVEEPLISTQLDLGDGFCWGIDVGSADEGKVEFKVSCDVVKVIEEWIQRFGLILAHVVVPDLLVHPVAVLKGVKMLVTKTHVMTGQIEKLHLDGRCASVDGLGQHQHVWVSHGDLTGRRSQVERERESGFLASPVASFLFVAHDRLPCIVRNSIKFTQNCIV